MSFESLNSVEKYQLYNIPTVKEKEFYNRANDEKWLDNMMSNCILDGGISSGATCVIDYLLCHHSAITEQILHELGVTPNVMNEFEISAHETRIGFSQWREIVK